LRRSISPEIEALELNAQAVGKLAAGRGVDLVVNTTPLGMGARAGESPWPEGVPLPGMAFVYDLVYNPPETALMRIARDSGLACANGLGMLIEQARLAFQLWTGCEVQRDVMERAVKI
jgi:shikimate dehydrogenase